MCEFHQELDYRAPKAEDIDIRLKNMRTPFNRGVAMISVVICHHQTSSSTHTHPHIGERMPHLLAWCASMMCKGVVLCKRRQSHSVGKFTAHWSDTLIGSICSEQHLKKMENFAINAWAGTTFAISFECIQFYVLVEIYLE